ncbi:hypothetical protein D9M69_589880 [compost metagenome]
MKQRRHTEHAHAARGVAGPAQQTDAGDHVALQDLRALGHAAGAGGVDDVGEVVGGRAVEWKRRTAMAAEFAQ